jgi:hypothetical protein
VSKVVTKEKKKSEKVRKTVYMETAGNFFFPKFDPRLFSASKFIPLASWVPVQRRRTDFPVVYSHRAAAQQTCNMFAYTPNV